MLPEDENPVSPPPLPPGIGNTVPPRHRLSWARKRLRLDHPVLLTLSSLAIVLWILQMSFFLSEDVDASYPGDGQQAVFLTWIDRSLSGEEGAKGKPEWQRWLFGVSDDEVLLDEMYWTVDLGEERGVFNRYGSAVAATVYLASEDYEAAQETIEFAWREKKQDSKAGVLLEALHEICRFRTSSEPVADLSALDGLRSAGHRLDLEIAGRGDYRWWNMWVLEEMNEILGTSFGDKVEEPIERRNALFRAGYVGSILIWFVNIGSLVGIVFAWRRWRTGKLGWPKRRWASLGIGVIGAFGIFCVVDLFSFWGVAYFFPFGVWENERQMEFSYEMVWRLAPLVLIPVLLTLRPRNWVRFFGLAPTSFLKSMCKFSLLALAGFGAVGVFETLTGFLLEGGDYAVDPVDYLLPEERGWFGLFYGLMTACVAAPLGEEMAYRGILLPALVGRLGHWGGLVLSSTLFALAHMQYDFIGLLQVGFMGFVAGWLYLRTQSLWCPILLHVLQNFVATLVPWLYFFLPLA